MNQPSIWLRNRLRPSTPPPICRRTHPRMRLRKRLLVPTLLSICRRKRPKLQLSRKVIILRQLEGLSFPEVAQRMERSPDSVRKLWMRALTRLRQVLETPYECEGKRSLQDCRSARAGKYVGGSTGRPTGNGSPGGVSERPPGRTTD